MSLEVRMQQEVVRRQRESEGLGAYRRRRCCRCSIGAMRERRCTLGRCGLPAEGPGRRGSAGGVCRLCRLGQGEGRV